MTFARPIPHWTRPAARIAPRRTSVILQSESAECGIACLAMIANHYGHRTDLPTLRRRYDLSLKGMTLHDVIRLAAEIRLATRALRLDVPQLTRLRLPCVLHWDHNHFVVLTAVKARRMVIHDPAVGRRQVPLEEFSRRFTGIALEVWPAEGFRRRTERARVRIIDILRVTHGISSAAAQILLLSLVLEIITIAMPIGFQLVLDDVVVSADADLLILVVIGFGLLVGFRALTNFVRSWTTMTAGAGLALQCKMSLFSHLLGLPLSFFERRHVGDLASRFNSIDTVQKTLGTAATGLADGIMAFALLGMMWLYDFRLAMLAVAVTATYAIVRSVVYQLYRRANQEAIVCAAKENSHFIESLRGMPTIKALDMGSRRQAIWINYLADRVGADIRVQKLDLAFATINMLLFGLDRILIIYFGARGIMSGSLTIGMLVAFIAFKDQFSERITKLLDTIVQVGMLSVHGERIADVALAEPEANDASATVAAPSLGAGRRPVRGATLGALEICFRYGVNEPAVLSDFNIRIAAGECVAIAGPSGAGKTTLLKVLAGLLAPNSGNVLLDDVPIRAIGGIAAYRQQIACVLQDDRLFAGSIAENIVAFSPHPDRDRIELVARQAAIHEDIMRMPMKYETLVGDMGSSLSGGQLQRIVLARALYRSPRILLLDEATSHLDEDNERAINNAIRSLTITRILAAHRRSTLDMADRIVPLLPANNGSSIPLVTPAHPVRRAQDASRRTEA